MMQCQESNLPAKCHIKSLKRYVQKEYTKNKTQIKLRSKIAKIEDYIKQNETIYPEYDFQLLQIQLAKSIHFIDQKTLYSPESEVDVLINQYIYPRIEDIDEILHDILKSQKPKLLNFTKLEIFIKEVINELQPKNEEEYYIIRNSLLRICFSQLHIISPNLLFDLDPISFSNSCNTVIKSTPKDLCLNERLFSIEMLDKTIIELTETNSHLKEATENLKLLNFYVNPPDILNCVFSSLKCCEMFVHDNTYDEKKKKSKVQSEMSFDDFFPLFLAIFAVNPPPNSLRIGWFFTAMYGIDMAIPFSFAKLILTSAINTLKDFSLERFRMVSSDSF
ncbi:hypothetical protein GPJ56_008245 [Histomonas meleagridis]|uniref:uncharacterized protein n=1 Tax=Histomonas meleagridis TaxID=135588 RepID=UPI003559C36F|nr:hypothetical protein GPJ56_008245 [Histomonas meleagridis]KAH0797267.1 hypothetical protein GO595_009949 [Histomonas meleagridis]